MTGPIPGGCLRPIPNESRGFIPICLRFPTTEFLEDRGDVRLDRALPVLQAVGDLLIEQASGEQAEHARLLFGETGRQLARWVSAEQRVVVGDQQARHVAEARRLGVVVELSGHVCLVGNAGFRTMAFALVLVMVAGEQTGLSFDPAVHGAAGFGHAVRLCRERDEEGFCNARAGYRRSAGD
ncbi:MAG TPA: hypothetical protein VN043_01185 [Rhodanobacter sp.]|nr:hypothetical protein [Rhodanobacter sp.]